ncbi:MAG: amidohydrolase family protein [Acidobacteria bacterium]|nr:amidohydrolase family protein [Acidobacteriota bacterium]
MFGKAVGRALIPCLLWGPVLAQDRLVIVGGTIVDVRDGKLLPDSVLVLEGDRIASISAGERQRPQGATVIDASGKYLIPGLIDSHVHYAEWAAELYLNHGVTTVLDLGNHHEWIKAQKHGVESGFIPGPRIFVSATVLDGPPVSEGYFERPYVHIVKNAEEAAAALRQHIGEEADAIKVYDGLNVEMLRAIVREAQKANLPVIGHFKDVRDVVAAGAQGVEHLEPVSHAVADSQAMQEAMKKVRKGYRPPTEAFIDFGKVPGIIDLMVKNGLYLNPTLRISFMGDRALREKGFPYQDFDLLINDWRLRYVPVSFRLGFLKEYQEIGVWHWSDLSEYEQDLFHQGYTNSLRLVKMFADAGGKLYSGTDSTHMCPGGLSLHQELELLADAGVSPLQVLQSATIHSAELMRMQESLGTLETGKRADVLILDGNPLQDIRNTRKIFRVISRGRVLDGQYHADFENPVPNKMHEETSHLFPSPRIRVASPDVFQEAAPGVVLTVKGTGMIPYSFIRFNGRRLKTEFIDVFQLQAQIPSNLLQPGTHSVTVENPDFAWGTTYAPGATDLSHLGIRDRISNEFLIIVRPKGGAIR